MERSPAARAVTFVKPVTISGVVEQGDVELSQVAVAACRSCPAELSPQHSPAPPRRSAHEKVSPLVREMALLPPGTVTGVAEQGSPGQADPTPFGPICPATF